METWLTPYCTAYDECAGPGAHKLVVKQMARFFRGLADNPSFLPHFKQYLKVTPPQYLSMYKFAATWGSWKPVAPREVEPPRERGRIEDGWMDAAMELFTRPAFR